jgi:hypothetical protein
MSNERPVMREDDKPVDIDPDEIDVPIDYKMRSRVFIFIIFIMFTLFALSIYGLYRVLS